ncbi:MAG: hypothetical protein ACLQAH_15235 [Limisphaerales bacterium]
MSEFKYACPVCGQHIKCDSTQGGTTMECPTCFQKIVVPQAPASDDQKFIITGTKLGERPVPVAVTNGETSPPPAPEANFSGPAIVFVALFGVAALILFVFHGKIFKSGSGETNQVVSVTEEKPVVVPLPARAIAVFARGDDLVVDFEPGGTEVKDPAKAAFVSAFQADLVHPAAFMGPLELTDLPLTGRTVPGADGLIRYHDLFEGGLVMVVTLKGLAPNHDYLLSLNGNPRRAGNNHLTQHMPNRPEGFYDFSRITTDAHGHYEAVFDIRLPPGPYDVMFFVKDTTDWKIVLHHDFFRFTVI